ncbi:hypothetical protein ACQ5SO_14195 [Rhodovulum sp. DZ06]|uniref:hypothetical protein n=1 Tax=Rhodovulum sp. DZ06 TaxID=3425126 RepID=UPI003D32D040
MPIKALRDISEKAEFALQVAQGLESTQLSRAALWRHAMGLLNAFYALNEELKNRTQNTGDDTLKRIIQAWRSANSSRLGQFFGTARNTLLHQGAVQLTAATEWEEDVWHDTERPISRSFISIQSSAISDMPAEDFMATCRDALEFMQAGIAEIHETYRAARPELFPAQQPASPFDEPL